MPRRPPTTITGASGLPSNDFQQVSGSVPPSSLLLRRIRNSEDGFIHQINRHKVLSGGSLGYFHSISPSANCVHILSLHNNNNNIKNNTRGHLRCFHLTTHPSPPPTLSALLNATQPPGPAYVTVLAGFPSVGVPWLSVKLVHSQSRLSSPSPSAQTAAGSSTLVSSISPVRALPTKAMAPVFGALGKPGVPGVPGEEGMPAQLCSSTSPVDLLGTA